MRQIHINWVKELMVDRVKSSRQAILCRPELPGWIPGLPGEVARTGEAALCPKGWTLVGWLSALTRTDVTEELPLLPKLPWQEMR